MTTKSKTKWAFALALGLALTVVVLGLLTLTPMRAQAAPLVDVPARPLDDYVSGVITQSTTWTLDHSPYTLTANVTVLAGVTLWCLHHKVGLRNEMVSRTTPFFP